jgi:hypothetical protein
VARRRSSPLAQVARQTADLSWAAPFVVAQRVGRIGVAGTKPSPSDALEFQRMFVEKAVAFQQSWFAMWTQAFVSQLQVVQTLLAAGISLASGRHHRASQQMAVGLSRTAASVVSAGIAPVRGKVVANARRLARRRARP